MVVEHSGYYIDAAQYRTRIKTMQCFVFNNFAKKIPKEIIKCCGRLRCHGRYCLYIHIRKKVFMREVIDTLTQKYTTNVMYLYKKIAKQQ